MNFMRAPEELFLKSFSVKGTKIMRGKQKKNKIQILSSSPTTYLDIIVNQNEIK